MITSRTNQNVKLVNKLKRKKYRDRHERFLIEGKKFVDEAAKRGMIETVIATEDNASLYDNCITVSDEIFSYLSETKSPQGVMGIARMNISGADEISDGSNVLYLDGLQDAGNAGTLVRSAACAGFDAVITSKDSADLFSPKAVRASAGNIMCIKAVRDSGYSLLEELSKRGFEITAADASGDRNASFKTKGNVLVIGNEGRGISPEVMKIAHRKAAIPMNEGCESLNAAVSGSILMYRINGYL